MNYHVALHGTRQPASIVWLFAREARRAAIEIARQNLRGELRTPKIR